MRKLIVRKEMTGHMYRNSPYETCSDCRNCDGARCDVCKTMYKVENFSTDEVLSTTYDMDDAYKLRDMLEKHNLLTREDIRNKETVNEN